MSRRFRVALAIHGGAGVVCRDALSEREQLDYEQTMEAALAAGWKRLETSTSLDAVEAAVRVLEDSPLFNAGRGSVFNADGRHEMDAAVMCGRTRRAGAVAGVHFVRNPVSLARSVLEDGRHVFLGGHGAEAFAREKGLEFEKAEYFFVQRRMDQLLAAQKEGKVALDHDETDRKFGTVGAVALDSLGNLAAATSTGGLTNKSFGRIGDSPIIGAGTYADNRSCAVSCTGFGEAFIRAVVGHEISTRMRYLSESLEQAVAAALEDVAVCDGSGGVIAVDNEGNVSLQFNTPGMFRAWRTPLESAIHCFD